MSTYGFDKTARDLQWQAVLELVAARCFSDAARARLLQLEPLPDPEQAAYQQRLLTESLKLLEVAAPLPVRSVPPIDELSAALERQALGGKEQLRDLVRVLEQAAKLRLHTKDKGEHCPELKVALWSDPELDALQAKISQAIDDHAEIRDSASEGVRSARRSLRHVREQLKSRVSQLIGKYSSSLAGQYYADRDGRYVLPVRTEAQSQVDGIVLGLSGSGGTLYIEPRELTELNNRLHVAEAEVLREEAKVLQQLSRAAAEKLPEVRVAYEACLQADCLAATALWANDHGAHPVKFVSAPRLELLQFRHPLLMDQPEPVVANDIRLRGGQCLIISGPNAGGKTVALKCLGLAVWMARCGLPLPCDPRSTVGWFDSVLSDVGDEQSLSRSLSTFSAHISNLADYLSRAGDGTLILLDEIAGGTDPDEGAALAESMLMGFVERGAAVATTTHYDRLKQLGARDDDSYVNASVGFDMKRMLPTFQLALGIPGASSAFAVAQRYGIPGALVERAQALMPQAQLGQQQVLEQIEDERQRLSQLREQTETELHAQKHLSQQLATEKKRAFEQEKARLRKEAMALTDEVKASRALLRKVQIELEKTKPSNKAELRAIERTIGEAAAPITAGGPLTQALSSEPSDEPPAAEMLKPGMRVRVPHLQSDAEVLEIPSKGQVRLLVGVLKMSVPVAKIRLGATAKMTPSAPRKKRPLMEAPRPAAIKTEQNVCDLRGVRVEAGLDQVESFLDRMLQLGESSMFILHGHGTGAMKSAVREHVAGLPHIEHWEPAQKEDGGDAFTVCWLRG